jgi:hypothetical protein
VPINITVNDLSQIDSDGNLIPDATALLQPFLILFGADGKITIVISLNDDGSRGGTLNHELSLDTVLGPINLALTASTLDAIIAESGGLLGAFNTGRLIVTLSPDPAATLDGPSGVDPLGEFDLEDDIGPLPPPQNLFARVNVALTSVVRGVPPTWTFLETLPGAAFFSLQLNGPGIAGILESGVEIGAYTYDVDMTQTGENIIAEQPVAAAGWEVLPDEDVLALNLDNADDAADARLTIADDGDDTVSISSNNASAIYGTNAVPRIISGGGGDGGSDGCFIATAAFGTPLASEIDALRGARDQYMLSNAFGALFADAYYRLSPPIAASVAQNEALKSTVRVALVPVIGLSRWLLASPASVLVALVALGALGSFALRMRRA